MLDCPKIGLSSEGGYVRSSQTCDNKFEYVCMFDQCSMGATVILISNFVFNFEV